MRYSAIVCIAFALGTHDARPAARTSSANETSSQTLADVVLADAHSFVVRDSATSVPYRIYVALPPDYKNGTKRYATLYALDADGTFALVTQAYRLLKVDSKTPDLVLVGIGYDLPGTERRAQRLRDLTPTKTPSEPQAGEAHAFLRFFAATLIPTIDARYRTDASERAIVGHSLGGLFVLYALFERPDLFARYIASSPSLWWDEAAILRHEAAFSKGRKSLPKAVFMSVGSDEPADMKEYFQPLADGLKSRNHSGLKFTSVVLPDETHLTAFSAAFLRGLRTVYP